MTKALPNDGATMAHILRGCGHGASGVSLLGAALTYLSYTTVGPWVCTNVPLFDRYMATAPFIQGPLFAIAGVAHFAVPESFTCFYPIKV